MKLYDVIVIGGGPAGYTAAMYASRAGLSTLVIEKMAAGGQMTQTMQIDNYPGFEEGVDGFSLGMKMQLSAERFGAETLITEVTAVKLDAPVKSVTTEDGEYSARTVIVATGANHRHLGLESEHAFAGRGVAYCAACDGMLYRGKTVAVIGGGNSAAADALLLSRICEKVILVHRRDSLRATKIYHEPLMKAENVEFHWNSTVEEIMGDGRVQAMRLKNTVSGEEETVEVGGVFVSIGRAPATELFKGVLDLDEGGYIVADESTRTNLPGVYAVGDVRTKMVRQVVTAVSDGAVAVHFAEQYIAENAG
ncbi:MAG: thioredoxin-disulfide reductase [Clostridiales bacterium]|nr:thioredoxin-disulfide reductase [Clostridiales bacterium]